MPPKIFIDADGCPVKDETYRVAQRLQLEVEVVCNRPLSVPSSARVRLVVVAHGSDEADKYIAASVTPGDVVVTTDLPLAARVVVGVGDPNPLVDGGGVATLRAAGIEVEVGCDTMNRIMNNDP